MEVERRWWTHWQNLNEGADGKVVGPPWQGRAWLHGPRHCFMFHWNFWSSSCGVGVTVGGPGSEDAFSWSICLPPIGLYFSASSPWLKRIAEWLVGLQKSDMSDSIYTDRVTSLRVFDWAVWWQVWVDDMGWTSRRPKWRDGNFRPVDFLLGREKHSERELETWEGSITLPEGSYPATAKRSERTWKRPRWFAKRRVTVDVDIPKGIPVPGRGENSWDRGDDAVFGMSCDARTIPHAIGKVIGSVLETRAKRGGRAWEPDGGFKKNAA